MEEYIVNNKHIAVNVFDKVRNELDAYFLGYLFCDGAYHRPTHKRNHRMSVSSTNIEIIDAFVEHYQPTSSPMERSPNSNESLGIHGKLNYKNFVLSSKFSPYLEKFGVMTLKKDRIYQNIPKKFFSSFLLGCFDADGSISWGKRKDRNRLWADFKITHNGLPFLKKLQTQIYNDFKISSFVAKKSEKEDCYVLRFSERTDVAKMFDILYENTPSIFNARKQNHYEQYVKELRA